MAIARALYLAAVASANRFKEFAAWMFVSSKGTGVASEAEFYSPSVLKDMLPTCDPEYPASSRRKFVVCIAQW